MISKNLQKARDYEEKSEKKISISDRPAFHLTPRVGWMNDPNGFSYFDGKYHMFYQYYPYNSKWGPMHWGHAVSTDMINWEYLPAALAPDEPFDNVGCFSGSAVDMGDGRHLLVYTGVMRPAADAAANIKTKKSESEDNKSTVIDTVNIKSANNESEDNKSAVNDTVNIKSEDDGSANIITNDREDGLLDYDWRDLQVQCVAVGDGIDYVKYSNNPVIDASLLPEGCSERDFRDPKVWKKADGTYCCVAGSRPADGSGQIVLFTSQDGFEWKYKSILAENKGRFGTMWECPDFFELDGKWVLLTSPCDMKAEGYEYVDGNGTLCLIGEYEEAEGSFSEEYSQSIEYGIDFYAPQTVVTPDGRRVMIGWMQNWGTLDIKGADEPWFGQMTIPREIHVRSGRLLQWPARELDLLRDGGVHYRNVELSGMNVLEGVRGRKVDITIAVRPAEGEFLSGIFEVRFAQKEEVYTTLICNLTEGIATIDRSHSGVSEALANRRSCRIDCKRAELKLRIILDRFSAEIFVNDGEQAMTVTMYTEQSAEDITFIAEGIQAQEGHSMDKQEANNRIHLDVDCYKLRGKEQ